MENRKKINENTFLQFANSSLQCTKGMLFFLFQAWFFIKAYFRQQTKDTTFQGKVAEFHWHTFWLSGKEKLLSLEPVKQI